MSYYLDCNKFNIGEYVVRQYLENDCGETVIDVSKNQEYWVQDVDFLAIKGGITRKIEVKYDNYIHKTQCFFVELLSNIEKQTPGWIDITKAHLIYYFDPMNYICYVIRPKDIRDWISNNQYEVKYCRKDSYKTSCGAIVPIKDFETAYDVIQIDLQKYK